MTVVAFVPARSGSKRLPGKNVRLLAGKPLVVWTLEACALAKSVDKVIFSTDSTEYWDTVTNCFPNPKLQLHLRSASEAGDNVKIFDYLKSAHREIFPDDTTTFVLALPTVPFRTFLQIDEAVALYRSRARPVFSASEYGFAVSFAFSLDCDGTWRPMFPNSPMVTGNTRSQDQQKSYHPNGAIYVRSVADLGDAGLATLYDRALPYLMDANSSIDIDNEIDFVTASAIALRTAPEGYSP